MTCPLDVRHLAQELKGYKKQGQIQLGDEVSLVLDGIEALAAFFKAPFDFLTDYEMPAMDGLSLAGHIKARSPNTPIILLTGADRDNSLTAVGKGPVDSVIFKPFMLEALEKTVLGVLTPEKKKNNRLNLEREVTKCYRKK